MTHPFLKNPWVYFSIFSLSNVLISYCPLSLEFKLWIAVFGLALPFGVALASIPPRLHAALGWVEGKKLPGWAWLAPLGLGVCLRLAGLTTLSAWPVPDEGLFPYFAVREIQNSDWRFFYHRSEQPPFFPWLLGGFFKIVPPSLFSLWLFPALLSILTLFACVWAARLWLRGTASWFFAFFMAVNFWALYGGRFNTGAFLLVLPLGAAVWALLAPPFQNRFRKANPYSDLLFGLGVGAGFWTFPSWPVVALPAIFYYLKHRWKRGKGAWLSLAAFLVFPLFFISTFVFLALRNGYGAHLKESSGFGSDFGMGRQILNSLSYLTAPFWGRGSVNYYGPVWGGMIGAIMAALVFVGFISILRGRTPFKAWAYFSILAVGVLPGLLAYDFEIFRIFQWVPFLMAAASAGMMELLASTAPNLKKTALAILLISSFLPEAYQLFGPYHQIWGVPNEHWVGLKSIEFYRAYGTLSEEARKNGEGLVLSDISQTGIDQTFKIACHPFDAAHNPQLDPDRAHWCAVLANANYGPFLKRRFPQGRWIDLSEGMSYPAGGEILGIIPVLPENSGSLRRFLEAERSLEPVTALFLQYRSGQSQDEIFEVLSRLYPFFRGDPFLESCYWEKVYFHDRANHLEPQSLEAVTLAVQRGYPAAHLLYGRGMSFYRLGFHQKGLDCLRKAVRAPVDLTIARQQLLLLQKEEK